jgi:hypothetical protein
MDRWRIGLFLRTGLRPDGQYVPPYMPKLANISDEDMYSLIAFLRSDNDWVKAEKHKQPECDPSFFTKFLTNIKAFEPYPFPEKNNSSARYYKSC